MQPKTKFDLMAPKPRLGQATQHATTLRQTLHRLRNMYSAHKASFVSVPARI